jgi:hypothetical protein
MGRTPHTLTGLDQVSRDLELGRLGRRPSVIAPHSSPRQADELDRAGNLRQLGLAAVEM